MQCHDGTPKNRDEGCVSSEPAPADDLVRREGGRGAAVVARVELLTRRVVLGAAALCVTYDAFGLIWL
jgi:hypothetical protein